MTEMTEECAEIIDLKRKLRDLKAERDRYLRKYVELLEGRSSGNKVAASGPRTVNTREAGLFVVS